MNPTVTAPADAFAIAALYANDTFYPPAYEPLPHLPVPSEAEIDWAWAQYADVSKAVSLEELATSLNANQRDLICIMRYRFGYEYCKIAQRRGTGGDLYRRDMPRFRARKRAQRQGATA